MNENEKNEAFMELVAQCQEFHGMNYHAAYKFMTEVTLASMLTPPDIVVQLVQEALSNFDDSKSLESAIAILWGYADG